MIRSTKPGAGNKYFITKSKGGYSSCIQGKPTDANCNVLANCVGFANGAFNETVGAGKEVYNLNCNAENFIERAISLGLSISKEPKVGGIMVWRKGATLSGKDGAGHVAYVYEILDNDTVKTAESGYNSSSFWTTTRKRGGGNWGSGSAYTYRGCIVNPNVKEEPKKTNEELAQEVLEGKWGNGADRKKRLTAAGYDYSKVQAIVNDLVKPKPKPLKVGDRVVPIRLINYDGKAVRQYDKDYIITEIYKDRAVLKALRSGKQITWAAMNINNLRRVK